MLIMERISNRLNLPLVGSLKKYEGTPVFVTISPNPKSLHTIIRTINDVRMEAKVQYGTLPQKVQYEYCMRVIERCYNYSDDTKMFGSWELNKEGNVHMHFLFFDKNIKTDVDLKILQRDIYNCPETIRNFAKCKKNSKPTDWMNSIVYLNKPLKEVYDYIIKDVDKCMHVFPYYKTPSEVSV